jgi:hypothetical protein
LPPAPKKKPETIKLVVDGKVLAQAVSQWNATAEPDPVADFLADARWYGGCWLWAGERSRRGFGVHVLDGVRVNVKRAAHYLFGADHPGLTGTARIESTCESTDCVNPDHLTVAA